MITVTESAAKHISKSLTKRGKGVGIRIGVKTSGCSGLSYMLEYVDNEETTDNMFESNNVKVYIDPKSLVYLDGTEIDLEVEGLNEGLKFNNPLSQNECGCGESFNVK